MSVLFGNSGEVFTSTADLVHEQATRPLERELLEMFDGLRMPMLRYAVSFGLNAQDGEDVIQEVFLALFRHLRDGKPRDNLRSWVFRVTHNLALKRRGMHRSEVRVDDENAQSVKSFADPSAGPEETFLFSERQSRLLRVMQAMPEVDQACLRLRAEGLRYREIAEVLDISLGSVAAAVARSLEKLERAEVNYGKR